MLEVPAAFPKYCCFLESQEVFVFVDNYDGLVTDSGEDVTAIVQKQTVVLLCSCDIQTQTYNITKEQTQHNKRIRARVQQYTTTE